MRTALSLLLIVWLVTLLPTPASAAPPPAQNLTLRREGTHLYLTAKGARLALNVLTDAPDTPIATGFTLPSGDTVTLYSQALPYPPQPKTSVFSVRTKAGQTSEISLDATLKQWLPDDSKWNGHTFGNFLRGVYNNEGLSVSLENPVLFQGALLAVLTIRSIRGSGNVIKSQQLVRVVTAPVPGLQMLRLLDVDSGYPYAMPPYIPRLIVWGKRLLLFPTMVAPDAAASILKSKPVPQSELHEIDLTGRTLRTVGSFPSPYFPLGIVADRWLVLGLAQNVAAHPIWICDLKSQVSTSLAGNWKAYTNLESLRLPPPGSSMPYLALEGETMPVIRVPSGKRNVVLPGSRYSGSVLLWNGLVVITDMEKHRVTAYDARTGRRVKSFAWTEASASATRNLLSVLDHRPYASGEQDAPENIREVRSLLRRGADVNAAASEGYTPLLLAVEGKRHDTALLLLKYGAKANVRTGLGITPLMLAACYGWSDVIGRLLDKGANINTQDNEGRTALIRAATPGRVEAIRCLLERGADLSLRDQYGADALQVAHEADYLQAEKLLRQAKNFRAIRHKEGAKRLMRRKSKLGCGAIVLLAGTVLTVWLSSEMRQPRLLNEATRITSTQNWMHGNRLGGWIGCFWMSPHSLLFFREALNPTTDDADFGFHARMFRYDVNTRTETFLTAATRRFHIQGAYPGGWMHISPHGDWLVWRGLTREEAHGVKLDGSRAFCLDAPPNPDIYTPRNLDIETMYLLPDGKRWMEVALRENKTSYARVHTFDSPEAVQELPLSAPLARDYFAPGKQFAATKIAAPAADRVVEKVTFSPHQDRVAWTQETEQRPPRWFIWLRRLFRQPETEPTSSTTLWVSRPDGSERQCLGAIDKGTIDKGAIGDIDFLCWTPEGSRLSFIHNDTLYTVPVE